MRLVQTGNVGVAEYLDKPNNKKWISEDTFDRLHCEEVLPGDILISRLPEPAGRACIVPLLGTKMITAVDCTIVRTAPDMSNKFLVQYLSSQAYFDDVNTCLAGGTRQRISRGNLANFNVPIPVKKSEQDAIGMFFGYLDNLITLHQRQPFLQSPPDISLIVQLTPPFYTFSWEQRKAKEICSIGTGKSNTQDQVDDGKYPFYIRSDVPVRSNKYLYDCEAVITIGDGNIGKVFHYVNGKFDLHQRCYKMTDFKDIWGKYFFYYFSTKFYDRAMKMTAKATVDSVRLEMISEMDIKKPPQISEQKQIAESFANLDNLITLHQRQTIVYAVIRSIRKVILAERQYFAPPMVRKSP